MKKNKIEKRTYNIDHNIEGSKIEGRAAVYSSPSDVGYGFMEAIEPGAFDGADMSDVRALINHDINKVLGRTKSGTLTLIHDERGLSYSVDLPNTTFANDLKESISRGDISQSSFAFVVVDDRWETISGVDYRYISKISKVLDVSPVTYPGYEDTSVQMRSHPGYESFKEKSQGLEEETRKREQILRERRLLLINHKNS